MSGQMKDYTKLQALLEKEPYPLEYMHKFIGRNTPEFARSVAELENQFGLLQRRGSRASANGQHLALTYSFKADCADQIIEMLKATDILFDLLMVL